MGRSGRAMRAGAVCAGAPWGAVAVLVLAWAMDAAPASEDGPSSLPPCLGIAAQAAMYLAVAALPLAARRRVRSFAFLAWACALGLAGAALRLAGLVLVEAPPALAAASELLVVACQAGCMLWAMDRVSICSMGQTMTSVLVWQAALSVVLLLQFNMGDVMSNDVYLAVGSAGAMACGLLQARADRRASAGRGGLDGGARAEHAGPAEGASSAGQADGPADGARIPYRLMAVVSLVVLTIYALRASLPPETLPLSHLGSLVMPAAIAAVFALRAGAGRLRLLYNASLAMLVAAAALVALGADALGAGASLAAFSLAAASADASYASFSVFYFTVLCSLSRRYGIDSVRLFALAFGLECAAGLAGELGARWAAAAGWGLAAAVSVAAGLAVVAFVCLSTDDDYRTSWGTRRAVTGGESIANYYYSLPDICTAVARRYGLSRREEEVLMLLVQRKTAPDIARELCISEATVKSHSRSIYRKVDVHSRDELLELAGYPGEARGRAA